MGIQKRNAREVFQCADAAAFEGVCKLLCCGTRSPPKVEVVSYWRVPDATSVVYDFCQDIKSTRVVPVRDELEGLWMRCQTLPPELVVDEIHDQIISASTWQPQCRALHAVLHFSTKGRIANAIAMGFMEKANAIVKHLVSEVPECQEAASRLLLLWQLSKTMPAEQAIHVADEGGLMYFVAASKEELQGGADDEPVSSASVVAAERTEGGAIDLLDFPDALTLTCPSRPGAHMGKHTEAAGAALDFSDVLDDALFCNSTPVLITNCSREVMDSSKPATPGVPPYQAAKPECFDIGGGEATCDNLQLNDMFRFERRQLPQIPLITKDTLDYIHVAKLPDPFDFIAAYTGLA